MVQKLNKEQKQFFYHILHHIKTSVTNPEASATLVTAHILISLVSYLFLSLTLLYNVLLQMQCKLYVNSANKRFQIHLMNHFTPFLVEVQV